MGLLLKHEACLLQYVICTSRRFADSGQEEGKRTSGPGRGAEQGAEPPSPAPRRARVGGGWRNGTSMFWVLGRLGNRQREIDLSSSPLLLTKLLLIRPVQ